MFAAVFAYEVDSAAAAEFDAAYGSGGEWARFFRAGAGYLGTELWRGEERYLLIDRWESEAAYEAFLGEHEDEYRRRSAATGTLYRSETALGRFESV